MPTKFNDTIDFDSVVPFGSAASDFRQQPHSTFQEKYKPKKIQLLLSSTKSKNFKEYHFTNYMSSNECKEWKVLADIHNKWKASFGLMTEELRSEFTSTDIENRNEDKLMRLCKIISQSRNRKCSKRKTCNGNKCLERNVLKTLENKYKYSERWNVNVPLRIFAKKVKDTIYVCLIDLYHLAVPAVNYKLKRRSSYKDHERHYANINAKINNKCCISSVDVE